MLKYAPVITVDCAANKLGEQNQNLPPFDWKKFFELIWPDVWSLLGAIFAALAAALMNIQIPIYLGTVINVMTRYLGSVTPANFNAEMQGPVFSILGLYVAQSAATFVYIYLLSNLGERLATRLKCELYSSILRQDLAFFDQKRTGDLVDCITSDVQEFKSAFKMVVSQGLRSLTQIVGCVVSMYVLSPTMTMGMLVIVPTVIVGGTMVGAVLRSVSRAAQQQSAAVTTVSEETISNIRTVRAFANEQLELQRFQGQVERAQTLYQKLGAGIALFQAGTNLFLNGIVLASLTVGGYLIAAQELDAGKLMSFLVATQTIQRSLAQLSLLFGSYVRGVQAGARVFQFINTEEKIPLTGGKIIPAHSLVADVEFENVTFAYPTRPQQVVLKDFNLKLPAGKTVAIVGTSGNGKSTIAALLERFYDVDGGTIRVGGVDVRELDPSWLRGQTIGIINQEPVLFATSILENIRYGRPQATDQEVYEVARLANADQFISQFPEGYNTVLGERGVTVSGGQKQRIAIARALLKNPAILILDEATSALDTESEKVVQHALEQASRNRTVLVIAHRLSTVQHADIIVVLSAGHIVEMGNHESLIKKKGYYWNLMNQQSSTNRSSA
ncbi:mitochondrial potassium channel ATP-binding subunit isoform X2 [Homalodisca vitripennis]|nr:mitochondrial potassium channel ATP-binding subunit isoform X2 [Homalodisca vitripennis]